MIKFRKELEALDRFDLREEILEIIQGRASEDFAVKLADLEDLVRQKVAAADENPYSTKARYEKVVAISLLRDFKYGNRNYKYLKGVGLSGLYAENYKSSDTLSKL